MHSSRCQTISDEVLNKYLDLLLKEIDIVKPKIIITFGNQVSSIILNTKISVSQSRKTPYDLNINKTKYKVYPVYYPVGNGIFNIDKAIEDIKWIINQELWVLWYNSFQERRTSHVRFRNCPKYRV